MTDHDETTVQLKFRVRERLRADLEQAARERRTSLNAEIVRRLALSFEQQAKSVDLDSLRAQLTGVAVNITAVIYQIYKNEGQALEGDALRKIGSDLLLIASQTGKLLESTYPSDERWLPLEEDNQ